MKRVLFGLVVVGLAAAPLGCNLFEPNTVQVVQREGLDPLTTTVQVQ